MEIKLPKNVSAELAEETGWHIGDGSMNFYKQNGRIKGIYQLRGHIKDDRQNYIERIKPIFKKLYSIKVSLREMPSTGVFGFQIWNNELVKFKQNLGLPLGKKINVFIPDSFLSKRKLITSVIRGIFDTDGGVYLEKKNNKLYPRITITTISFMLSKQLVNLLQKLGLRATTYKENYKVRGNRVATFVVSIRGNEMFHKFIRIIKPKNLKHLEKYLHYMKSFK